MADESSRPARPSWRGGDGADRPQRGPDALWKRRAREERRPAPSWSRTARIARAAVACLIGVGLVVWLLLMISPVRPASVLLVGADYATNLAVPPNVLGWEGIQGVRGLTSGARFSPFWRRPKLRRALPEPITLKDAAHWDEVLHDLKRKGIPGNTVLIVLGLHGVTDPAGRAYLLPNRAAKPTDGIELGALITSLKALPPNKTKVLVLEAAQVPADGHLGMVHNGVARRLRELDREGAIAAVPNLWVLSAADVDQRCWASEGLRRTAFAHFLIEGLRGAAAGADGRVTLAELHEYVLRNVRHWAFEARGAVQEPVLLPGKAADRDARRVVLALASDRPAPARNPLDAELPAPVARRWEEFARLAQQAPPPSTYSPWRWAAYRAAVVRYDQLARAGASAPAEELARDLDRLRARLENDRREQLRSLSRSGGNGLALHALRGGSVALPPSAALTRLWDAPDPDLEKAIADYRRASTTGADPRLPSPQTRAENFLYQRAEDDPRANLAKAAARLVALRPPDAPLSAEAHFLIMLDRARKLPPADRPSWFVDLLKQALRVRRLAERTALGIGPEPSEFVPGEQVAPWVASRVEHADRSRRLGEDLLLSSEEPSWNDARAALDAAEGGYRVAGARAEAIREAIALRDRALADLPEFARWLSNRPEDPARSTADDSRRRTVRELFDRAHDLAGLLRQPNPELNVTELARRLEQIRGPLDALGRAYLDERDAVDQTRQARDWEAATAAASSAPAHAETLGLRRSLWRRLSNIAARDVSLGRTIPNGKVVVTDADRLDARSRSLRRACDRAATALAAVGPDVFDADDLKTWDDRTPEPSAVVASQVREEGYSDVTGRLAKLQAQLVRDFAAESELDALLEPEGGNGYGLLGQVGGQVGRRWRGLPPAINRLVNEGNLALADRYEHQADGLTADLTGPAPEAAALYRDARTRDALAWLAERTWLDHWYDRNPKSPPYYQNAGRRFLDDLDLIVRATPPKVVLTTPTVEGGARPWPRPAQAVRGLYARPDALGFDRPDAPVLTSELSAQVWYRLTGMDPDLAGAPVVWAEAESESRLRLDGPTPGQRLAWEQNIDRSSSPALPFTFSSPLLDDATPKPDRPAAERTALTARGEFRGRPFERTTDVVLHPLPEVAVIVPPLLDGSASIAVRADREVFERFGSGTGAIAVVLDCSGSMGKDEEGTKFHDARKALASVLRTVPRGTIVSVWVFGEELRGYDLHDPIAVDNNRNPEKTIKRLLGPVSWDSSQVVILNRQLDAIEAVHATPLVQAMDRAAEDLDRFDGFKTLLVLTDGKDTRFAQNETLNPLKLSIPAFLAKRFGRSGIAINMIAFKVEDEELAAAKAQFAEALAQLDPPGRFIQVSESRRLTEALRNALPQKLSCRLRGPDRLHPDALDVSALDEPDRWLLKGLAPGHYTLEVKADQVWTKDVDLDPGDRLIVRLVAEPDGSLGFHRALYSDDFPTRKPFAEGARWRLAVLQNQGKPGGGPLRMEASLEALDDPRDYLFLNKPHLTWFELVPSADSAPPFAVRWRPRTSSPAPLWQIEVPSWPPVAAGEGPSAPTLRVWWEPDGPRTLTMVRKADRFQPPPGGDRVIVEGVASETRLVETRPGGPREPMPCLVIRLKYPAGKPYWVDPASLAGVEVDGYEHRFYTSAERYTGIFWPVTGARLDADLTRFGLVSLAQLRRDAERGKQVLELKPGPPRPGDKAPEPPPMVLGP